MRASTLHLALVVSAMGIGSSVSVAAPADDPVQKAIGKGVKYLQFIHQPQARYDGGSNGIGSACLAGLALLECGAKDNDPAIRNVAAFVRDRALQQTETYQISLAIMFLDKLGNAGDQPFIQFLGVRLLSGQTSSGGWSYSCGDPLSPQEETRLKAIFIKESRLTSQPAHREPPPKKGPSEKEIPRSDLPTGTDLFTPMAEKKKPAPVKKDSRPEPRQPVNGMPPLHPEVAKLAKLVNLDKLNNGEGLRGALADNSNTQFGALGLWVARRHGVAWDVAFELLDKRFRSSQDADGGWSYHSALGGASPAMTCAGLIALAAAHGSRQHVLQNRKDNPKPNREINGKFDPANGDAIQKGLRYLGNAISEGRGMGPRGRFDRGRKGQLGIDDDDLAGNLYFMWSLERVAVIYGLETIGKQDWYAWGSAALVKSQTGNGSWIGGRYPGANEELNTCFALLFLSRANVAKDLTATLQGKVGDPGVAMLRGGGVLPKVAPANPEPAPAKKKPADSPEPRAQPPFDPARSVGTPPAETEMDASRLCDSFVKAAEADRARLLVQLRDSRGGVYTDALARAAGKLSGERQRDARDALAKRLTRMTASTLREMCKDDDSEIRRAALLACGMKADRTLIPCVIDGLGDNDAVVIQAARISLRLFSDKDFGPAPAASAADKRRAIAAWKTWWAVRGK